MDFTFSLEQEALRGAVRSFVEREGGRQLVRSALEDGGRLPSAVWQQMVDLGWAGLLIPAELGGTGLGLVDLVVVQEELGKWAFPGPFLSSAVQATVAARHLGADDLLRDLATGTTRGTLAVEELGSIEPLADIGTTAEPQGSDEYRLHGLKPTVLDADTADWALVVARDPAGIGGMGDRVGDNVVGRVGDADEAGGVGRPGVGGVGGAGDSDAGSAALGGAGTGGLAEGGSGLACFLVEQPAGEPVPGLDVTRRLCRLELDGRPARRVGPAGDQTELLQRVVDDVAVALCAETVGACDAALAMAVDYAKTRVQFDRPIGSFQAIRHKIVDMLHHLELARVGTHFAAWAGDADDPERASTAAMAKGFVGEAANMITAENIQVHGGVGFTWDVDCHLYYRRVKQNDVSFGRAAWNRQRLADLVLSEAGPT